MSHPADCARRASVLHAHADAPNTRTKSHAYQWQWLTFVFPPCPANGTRWSLCWRHHTQSFHFVTPNSQASIIFQDLAVYVDNLSRIYRTWCRCSPSSQQTWGIYWFWLSQVKLLSLLHVIDQLESHGLGIKMTPCPDLLTMQSESSSPFSYVQSQPRMGIEQTLPMWTLVGGGTRSWPRTMQSTPTRSALTALQ